MNDELFIGLVKQLNDARKDLTEKQKAVKEIEASFASNPQYVEQKGALNSISDRVSVLERMLKDQMVSDPENVLQSRAERAEAMVERLMRMVEDRFVLVGNSLDGHLQDCNCAVFLSSRMERDAWSELRYEWHGIYSDWQSANGHQAGKVSENEGSEG